MGDAGVSSAPDVYSMHWNPAKYAVLESDMSVGLSYSPWLRNLVPDMNLAYLAFAKRIDASSAIGATLRFFTLGDIQFTNDQGGDEGTYRPSEWALDATYSRKLTDHLSGAVAGRFIYSNLTLGRSVGGGSTSAGISEQPMWLSIGKRKWSGFKTWVLHLLGELTSPTSEPS